MSDRIRSRLCRIAWCIVLAIALGLGTGGVLHAQEATSELECGSGNLDGCNWGSTSGDCAGVHTSCPWFVSAACVGTSTDAWWCFPCSASYRCVPGTIRCNDDRECGDKEKCLDGLCQEVECALDSHCPAGRICTGERCIVPEPEPGPEPDCRVASDCPFGSSCVGGHCCNTCPPGEVKATPVPPVIGVSAQCVSFPPTTCTDPTGCPLGTACIEVYGLESRMCLRQNPDPGPGGP